jgi:hypothetical protein
MNRIAPEIAKKIRVLLQYENLNAAPREEQAQHHSRRPSADDAAGCSELFHRVVRACC